MSMVSIPPRTPVLYIPDKNKKRNDDIFPLSSLLIAQIQNVVIFLFVIQSLYNSRLEYWNTCSVQLYRGKTSLEPANMH